MDDEPNVERPADGPGPAPDPVGAGVAAVRVDPPDDAQAESVDDGEIRDALPADLDITGVAGVAGGYAFPDNARRRGQGLVHLSMAAVLGGLWAVRHEGGVLVNRGFLAVAVLLAVIGVYHLLTARPLEVRELDALSAASREVGFPVGHASAQMAWRGLLSVPTWRVLVYSTDEPPTKRGLVVVDGTSGAVLGSLVEDNPEDFTAEDWQGL